MKLLSTPSTTITPRWPNIEIFKTSLSSWLELKVSDSFSIVLQAMCFAPVPPPVSFCLKTFLLSEDRFQYKGAAHSKLTRPALSSLKLFAWHRGVLRQVVTHWKTHENETHNWDKRSGMVWSYPISHPSWPLTQWGLKQTFFAPLVFCRAAFGVLYSNFFCPSLLSTPCL